MSAAPSLRAGAAVESEVRSRRDQGGGRRNSLARRVAHGATALTLVTAWVFGGGGLASKPAAAATAGIPACGGATSADGGQLPSALPLAATPRSAPPQTSAVGAVVLDGETGRVLYDDRARNHLPPASTTKIMTALLAIEQGDLQRVVVSDIDASKMVGSSVMGLRPGVPITMQDLLYGLMLPSGNDAAIEIARAVDGNEHAFVQHMNRKAAEIGLSDTHFMNPHGLDARGHYSTALDLARLARYAMRDPAFAALVGTRDYRLGAPSAYDLHNGNSMLGSYAGADGVKIGWTEAAGWTLVASAQRDGHRLFAVVLNSKDRDADASGLLDWAFTSYRWVTMSDRTEATLRLAMRFGLGDAVVRSFASCS